MSDWIRRALALLAGLSPRERLLIIAAGALVLAGIGYLVVIAPVVAWQDRAEQRLATAEQQFTAMQRLRREYDDVNVRIASLDQRIQNGTRGNLRTTLEGLARQASVKVESMEPQASPANDAYREEKVEVGLKNVTLQQTVTYLHGIEESPQVLSVKSLRIRTRPEQPELLDVTFTVSSFEPLQ